MVVAPAINLDAEHRQTVVALLSRYLPNTTVWAYGSRVKWTSHPASDLDLVAFAKPEQAARVAELREAFDESNLPFRVDLFVWDDVPKGFRRRIKAEHVVLADRKLRKAKDRSDLTRSVVSPNPNWQVVSIGEVAEVVGGGTPSTKDPTNFDGDIPWLTPKDLSGVHDRYMGRGARNLSQLGLEGSSAKLVPAGSVLLTTRAPVGYVALAKNRMATNQGFRSLIPHEGVIPEFLYYWLLTNTSELERHATGSTFKELSGGTLAKLSLSLPPKSEQGKIVAVLGALDDKIELNRRIAVTLEEALAALFKSWFVDFDPVRTRLRGDDVVLPEEMTRLFPSRLVDSEVGMIPDGWGVSSLGELVEFAYGSALRSGERRGGDIPVFGSNGRVGWHDQKLVNGPGIVVGRKGNPGVVTWSQTDFFPIDTTFYVIPRGKVSLWFLFYALRRQNLFSIAADSAVPGLNRNIAYMNRQLVPSAEVLEAFDSQADAILSRRDQIETGSRTLTELRDVLLPKLISGEVRVADAEEALETIA